MFVCFDNGTFSLSSLHIGLDCRFHGPVVTSGFINNKLFCLKYKYYILFCQWFPYIQIISVHLDLI